MTSKGGQQVRSHPFPLLPGEAGRWLQGKALFSLAQPLTQEWMWFLINSSNLQLLGPGLRTFPPKHAK